MRDPQAFHLHARRHRALDAVGIVCLVLASLNSVPLMARQWRAPQRDWMGKTGTPQNPHGPDHGWFVGIAGPPDGDPEIVVAALIEGGEHGSDVAQIAAKAADYYLRTTRNMSIDTIQTLREHWQKGIPARWAQWD